MASLFFCYHPPFRPSRRWPLNHLYLSFLRNKTPLSFIDWKRNGQAKISWLFPLFFRDWQRYSLGRIWKHRHVRKMYYFFLSGDTFCFGFDEIQRGLALFEHIALFIRKWHEVGKRVLEHFSFEVWFFSFSFFSRKFNLHTFDQELVRSMNFYIRLFKYNASNEMNSFLYFLFTSTWNRDQFALYLFLVYCAMFFSQFKKDNFSWFRGKHRPTVENQRWRQS